jgi:hypothetical protein
MVFGPQAWVRDFTLRLVAMAIYGLVAVRFPDSVAFREGGHRPAAEVRL